MATWIPLLQTLVWPIFVTGFGLYFRDIFTSILQAMAGRISSGSSVKVGPGGIELGAVSPEMKALQSVPSPQKAIAFASIEEPTDWRHRRTAEYERAHGYMMVHIYRPSERENLDYDIFLFLVRHEKGSVGPPRRKFEEIEKAEFFFGSSWNNKVFTVENSGGIIGIRTHAWGTFLASCRITFKDRTKDDIVIFRYVDFHMLQDVEDIQ